VSAQTAACSRGGLRTPAPISLEIWWILRPLENGREATAYHAPFFAFGLFEHGFLRSSRDCTDRSGAVNRLDSSDTTRWRK
jgi:hypothetical protein